MILYVDNDLDSCEWVRNSLLWHEKGLDVRCVTEAGEALDQMDLHAFDVCIIEYSLPEMSGAELCRKIRLTGRKTSVIIYSDIFSEVDRKAAIDAGANAFVMRSDGFGNLLSTVRRLLGKYPTVIRHNHIARASSSII